jgi:tetratricopeptide (TPR) repeat protein
MSRNPGCSSIQVSPELTCRVLPLVVEQKPHFSSLETGFFQEGDALTAQTVDTFDEPTSVGRARRSSRKHWPVAIAVLGAAGIASLILFLGAHRKSNLRPSSAVVVSVAAAQPIPVVVPIAAQTAVAAEIPAQAPVVARQAPSPPPATAGAVAAAPGTDDAVESCRKAFDQHHSKDVLFSCAQAFASTPTSAEIAVMLSQTEFDRGHARQALAWAQKAIAIDSERANAYVYLGGAEQAAGHKAAAKSAYKRYLQLAPQGRYAAELRAVLASL